jgi:hypothetical protein
MTIPLPPAKLFAAQTTAMQRTTLAHLIERHLAGELNLATLSQWALQAFHALAATADDEDAVEENVFDDDSEPVIDADPAIVTTLDTLMFADQPEFAPSPAEFAAIVATLRS